MNVQNRWDSFKQRRGQSLGSPERGDGEDYDREDGEGEGETDELAERRPLVSEKQSKAEKGSELGRAELKPGDYQVLVNIIEVKDLIPLDLNGLTDPLVSVEVLKNKRSTKHQDQSRGPFCNTQRAFHLALKPFCVFISY
jgi:hypothetical protein